MGIGLCLVDHLYRVDDSTLTSERTRYYERLESPGGMVSNALIQAAALGCPAELLTLVGDDSEGRWLLRELRARGVSTRRVVRSREFPTTNALVLVNKRTGERRFVLMKRKRIELGSPDFDVRGIRANSIVHVDGHYPRQTKMVLERARELGATVVGDFTDARAANRRALRFVDFPIVPTEFAERLGAGGPRDTLRALHAKFGGTPVITLGAKGALALIEGRIRRIRPHRARVVDTTGAGDAFHGGFIAGLARGMPVLEALDLGSRAGARACTALGATTQLLSASDLC